ncbi:MAG: SpoVA/SpoVAEb family sporulation membrane protein [Bacilli bacterium]|nr:SpoVA/SpoVAEb family sporulation membrane protein [Bacilli bacterium]
MNKDEYKKLVKSLTPKENKVKNTLLAFLSGGIVGVLGELEIYILMNFCGVSRTEAFIWLCISLIFIGCFLTSLGFFDNLVTKFKAGLIIPTTGFAHSISSSALDYKKDGLITGLGANFFKLAGSVILYGILSAFLLLMIRMVIECLV